MQITVKLLLTAENIAGKEKIYLAKNICSGHYTPQDESHMPPECNNNKTKVLNNKCQLQRIQLKTQKELIIFFGFRFRLQQST